MDLHADITTAMTQRYGAQQPPVSAERATETLLTQLNHLSVRAFTGEEVPDEVLRLMVAAAQSASTSSNLQPWSVVVVRDRARLARLARLVGDTAIIEQAPVLLVWLVDFARTSAFLEANEADAVATGYLESTLVGFVDTSLAAQNALLQAEALGFGGVFLGCIRNNPEGVAAELGLPQRTVAAFGMAIGRPRPEGHRPKPRLPFEAVVHAEGYSGDGGQGGNEAYEQRLREYYETQGKPGYSWLRTLRGRIGTVAGLHGREAMRARLRERGLPSE